MSDPVKFKHPFNAIIAGPSGSGKSYFVVNFLKNITDLCDTEFSKVTWFYSTWQTLYNTIPNVNFQQGLPDMDNFDGNNPHLIIIDDLMRETDSRVVDIFTKGSHHKNLSVFFITQNIFNQGKGQRDISLNAHYIVYFKNPRDKAQILHLSRQVCPENTKFIQDAYNDATSEPYNYLIFDLKQSTPEWSRFRTVRNNQVYIYVPKKKYKYNDMKLPEIIT